MNQNNQNQDRVVTRFAPSPTGNLHLGSARTALFNWLWSRKNNGLFLLRIEDTDKARSKDIFTQDIHNGLKWLGLDWDREYIQSEHIQDHKKVAEELLDKGFAYIDDNATYFKVPADEVTVINDQIMGITKIENKNIEDFVILRSDKTPTYMMAVVVDDYNEGVTDIIRGMDHLTNTAKQILLYQALGWKIPSFSHIPLIFSESRKKLSKRDGARSITEYKELGYLPETIFNYLIRLGWSYADEEIFSKEKAIQLFSLSGVRKSPAMFDPKKINFLNKYYIVNSKDEYLIDNINLIHPDKPISFDNLQIDKEKFYYIFTLLKNRGVNSLMDLYESISFLFLDYEVNETEVLDQYQNFISRLGENFITDPYLETVFSLYKDFSATEIQDMMELAKKNCQSNNTDFDSLSEDQKMIFYFSAKNSDNWEISKDSDVNAKEKLYSLIVENKIYNPLYMAVCFIKLAKEEKKSLNSLQLKQLIYYAYGYLYAFSDSEYSNIDLVNFEGITFANPGDLLITKSIDFNDLTADSLEKLTLLEMNSIFIKNKFLSFFKTLRSENINDISNIWDTEEDLGQLIKNFLVTENIEQKNIAPLLRLSLSYTLRSVGVAQILFALGESLSFAKMEEFLNKINDLVIE